MKRNTDRSREENSTTSPGKRPYSSPKLSEFGLVRQLTAGGSQQGFEHDPPMGGEPAKMN